MMKIVEYDEERKKLDEIKDVCNFIPDVSTDEGYQKSKRVALDVGKVLTSLEKKRKERKAYFLNGGKEVDAQAKAIAEQLQEFQLPHKDAYKELDNLKKEREAARKKALEDRVEYMRTLPEMMRDSDSDGILAAMQQMQDEKCDDYYEYTKQAGEARNKARKDLQELYTKTKAAEDEKIELDKLRLEAEERAKKDREDQIRREASAKAEAETKAAKEREEVASMAAIQAEKDKVEIEKAALKAAKLAEESRIQAEKDAIAEAEKAAVQAREQAIRENDERIAKVQAEDAARAKDKKHRAKINNEAKAAILKVAAILDAEERAQAIVVAIAKGQIPNVSINY